MISVRMKSPGCGGFLIGMAFVPFILVIIFQVQVVNFSFVGINPKRQSPIARDAEAPRAFTATGQRMHFPSWQGAQFLRLLHVVEERQHFAKLIHRIGLQAF